MITETINNQYKTIKLSTARKNEREIFLTWKLK